MIGVFVAQHDGEEVTFLANSGTSLEEELLIVAKEAFDGLAEPPAGELSAKRVARVDVTPIFDDSTYLIKSVEDPTEKVTTNRKPDQDPGTAVVQSLIFSKDQFTVEEARSWISSHDGFGDYGYDETNVSYRFRQYDPQHFSAFRTKPITDGITSVIGIVGGEEKEASIDAAKAAVDRAEAVRTLNQRMIKDGMRLLTGSAEAIEKADGEEERFVLSLVLEPNDGIDGAPLKPDTQGDIYSAAEVRKTAHAWMEHYGQIDLQHSFEALGKQDVCVLESYLAPADFSFGEQAVVKGTWLLALRVLNDELWKAVKSGDIGAYSIGGAAMRTPLEEDGE